MENKERKSVGQILVDDFIASMPNSLWGMYSKEPDEADISWAKNKVAEYQSNLPTPEVDELNLDEGSLQERAINYAVEVCKNIKGICTRESAILSAQDDYKAGWKDNHASFVALVEGEIKNVEQAIDDAKGMFTSNNKIRLDTLTDLLNNIK